jgi:hypothetical protein
VVIRGARLAAAVAIVLAAKGARAESGSIEGWGRITVAGGYRRVPNGFFADRAAEAGRPMVRPSPGGPQGVASFGFGAFPFVEVAIDLLAGYETFTLEGLEPFSAVSYGGLLGPRFTKVDVLFKGFGPYLGVHAGPLLSVVSSTSLPQREKLIGAVAVSGGFNYRFAERMALTVDVRWILARNYVEPIAGANVGGFWFSLGFTIFFAPEPKRDLDVPGF